MDGRSIVVVRGGDRNSRHWNLAEEEEIMEWNGMNAENVRDIIVNMNGTSSSENEKSSLVQLIFMSVFGA